jgi:hypothetical protein
VSYSGTAYQKTGDATRRYLGSIRTNSSGGILQFRHYAGNRIRYLIDAPLVLTAGAATAETLFDCSAYVPVTSRVARLHVLNVATNGANIWIGAGSGAGDDSVTPPTSGILVVGATGGSKGVVDEIPLDSSRRASYAFDVAPVGAAYIYMAGYIFER